MTDNKPEGAFDPRPNNKPYYIDKECPECGTDLVLKALHGNQDVDKDEIWHDEYICPRCKDSPVYMDMPEDVVEERLKVDEGIAKTLSEVKKELGL